MNPGVAAMQPLQNAMMQHHHDSDTENEGGGTDSIPNNQMNIQNEQ
jgi:hypothetical protein